MTPFPDLSFDRLRAIGYGWDPVGAAGGPAQYDQYLLESVLRFRSGQTEREVAAFLVDVEGTLVGQRDRKESERRALFMAEAIRAYLEDLAT